MLLGTMYLTAGDIGWITFLAGILAASILALTSRASRAEWIVRRRTVQLYSSREKLAKETVLRARADEALSLVKTSVHYLDQEMPAMLAYVNADLCFQYHNRAFRTFRGVRSDKIDGRHLREVVGTSAYADIEDSAKQALAGSTVRFEGTQRAAGNTVFRLSTQFLPHFGEGGKVLGFFSMQTDITASKDLVAVSLPREKVSTQKAHAGGPAEDLADWDDPAGHIRAALENDEFCLYCQSIVPTALRSTALPFYEVLIRMNEEEKNMILPGSFLPFAEEHGMLPALDRWVVRHLLNWASSTADRQKAIFSLNTSAATICDPDFPQFVREQMALHPLNSIRICFELTIVDATTHQMDVVNFIHQLKADGCLFALSGIGPTPVSADFLTRVPVDYLKISGDLVLNILRDPLDLERIIEINRMAHTMGMSTIAEFVEDEPTLVKLRELKVDLAQGFGISRPRPLDELAQPKARLAS
jgi:EAL domain-containing protein (putative c-di-GMP-specific phosphodiesterase class I)/PAS domain-containing protein